jgi:hypothetical protein
MNCYGPSKRMFGASAIGMGLIAQLPIFTTAFAQELKPNILFILADNTGYGDIGAYGGGELRGAPTPRIDQFAAEGLRLTQFLVEKTYIVTGGGQDFVRVYSERVYGISPEQVVGSAGGTKFGYEKDGTPFLTKEPKLLLNDDHAGKPEGIHLMIGRRPYAAFGNSTGDQQMLEYTGAGDGARLMMLVLHDDGKREYAYGPAQGLPNSKVGTFTPTLYEEAKKNSWTVISMKNDWKRVFAFE